MSRRWLSLVLALLLLSAGCLAGGDETDADAPGEQPEPSDADRDGNETDTSSGDGGDEADSDDGSEEDDDTAGSDDADDGGEADEQRSHPWPDPDEAAIRPGVQVTGEGQCTSNFLFRTPDNATLMLGLAAHCVAQTPSPTTTSGCSDDVDPWEPGAAVEIDGASKSGTLVYSSWHAMQQANVSDATVCGANDFALVAIHPDDRREVHPAVLSLGGPNGTAGDEAIQVGEEVRWYGNTGATPDSEATNRHEGTIVSTSDWRFQAYSAAPGVPGDSGSGVMLADGSAAGVLATLNTVYPGANSVTKLAPALAFAHEGGLAAELVTWSSTASDLG